MEHARGKPLPNVTLEDFRNIPGEGLTARVTTLTGQQEVAKLGTIEYVSEGLEADAVDEIKKAVAREAVQGKESVMAAMLVGSKVSLSGDSRAYCTITICSTGDWGKSALVDDC